MFQTILMFFGFAQKIVPLATEALQLVAMMRAQNDPAVSNAGINNCLAAIDIAKPIVAEVDNVSKSGTQELSGVDKKAVFDFALQTAAAKFGADHTEAAPLINAAVTAICAKNKAANDQSIQAAAPAASTEFPVGV